MQVLKLKEIKNARLAMLGVAGFFAQVIPLARPRDISGLPVLIHVWCYPAELGACLIVRGS